MSGASAAIDNLSCPKVGANKTVCFLCSLRYGSTAVYSALQSGHDTSVTLGSDASGTIRLMNFTVANLDANDFKIV